MRAGSDTAVSYRCEAATVAGFIQQLAVACVARGYWFYVTGCVPVHKDARAVDKKLIERYGIDCSKWVRHRRKKRGDGNLQYLRFRRFFVLLATPGEHEFFRNEARIEDIRRRPIQCFGYSVGCYQRRTLKWHPSVRIERALFQELKREFTRAARSESVDALCARFARIAFEPYAPIRCQLIQLLSAVNRVRRIAGAETLPAHVLRLNRKVHMPFGEARPYPELRDIFEANPHQNRDF